MVYESDFYTTRRPYSSTPPYVSSYNITVRTLPHMPYAAHKRLVKIVHTPIRIYHAGAYLPIKIHSRVRPSIIAAELNRIRYLTRPSYESYTEKYLNSRDFIDFDDEAREIRAKTDNLLRKIHVFFPRPCLSDYDETSPERLRSDDYVRRIINAKNARKEIESLPWYTTPEKRDIGAGHLACIKYAGGRPQSRRRPYYTVGDLVPGDVRSDVNLMSYYMKNRKAAEDASLPSVHHSERTKETHDAPAPSVTWADEVVHEKEIPEEPVETEEEPQLEVKSEKKKEKKIKIKETVEDEDLEAEYDEYGVKKQPDEDTIKKVQEYLEKKAAEKKMEEERRAWEAAERRRIAEEKEIARLAQLKLEEDIRVAEIKEQERLEAERQAVIERAEAARQEAERLVEDEKLYNEAVAQAIADEEERVAKEKEEEEIKKKQEEEEEKTASVLLPGSNGVSDGFAVEDHSEEHSVHTDRSNRDVEATPYELDQDEDTQVEEDVHEEPEELENPFTDGEGAASSPQVEEAIEEESPRVRVSRNAGGDQGFDWSQFESEPEVEETCDKTQVEEETASAVDQEPIFEESNVESQAEVDETKVVEADVTDQVQVEEEAQDEEAGAKAETEVEADAEADAEVEAEEETQEETRVTEEAQVDETTDEAQFEERTEDAQVEEVTEETQAEETKVEDKSASEEEDEEEEDE